MPSPRWGGSRPAACGAIAAGSSAASGAFGGDTPCPAAVPPAGASAWRGPRWGHVPGASFQRNRVPGQGVGCSQDL